MIRTSTDFKPLVSVIVPVYNTERYVAETVRSLLAQTYRELEIIIVIDGSTDGSLAICRRFDDPRIRIVEQENRGLAGARNTGIRKARGELVGFLDSDDAWQPDKIECHVAHFASEPALGVSFSYSALMDAGGRPLGTFQKDGRDPSTFADFFVRNVMGNGSNAVLRKAVLDGDDSDPESYPAVHGFREELRRAEDYELWSRIASTTRWKLACLPRPLVRYRINPGGLSAQLHLQRQYHFLAMARIASYAPDEAESLRCRAVAHAYWHQARTAATQHLARVGTKAVKLAVWYDWRTLNMNHVMICLAITAALVLPERPYYAVQRWAGRAWGLFQLLNMRVKRRPGRRRAPQPVRPAATLVKRPEAYVREKAMPNLFFLCHRHRFMYLGVSKNASTSMKLLMWRAEQDAPGREAPGAIHAWWGFRPTRGRSIDRDDRPQIAEYPGYVKFAVYRDPVSRFLSAYHDRVLFTDFPHPFYVGKRLGGMGLDQFIRVAERALKIENPLCIDEHLRPQAWCYRPPDVDWIVPIEHLQAFLVASFGIRRERKANRTLLPRLPVTPEQERRIRQLYACDYAIEPNWAPSETGSGTATTPADTLSP